MGIEKFVKDRDDALLSLDKKKILEYCKKYRLNLPKNDLVFWASVHKAITEIKSATEEQKKKSMNWLIENGFKPYIDL